MTFLYSAGKLAKLPFHIYPNLLRHCSAAKALMMLLPQGALTRA
jgi:hypothetical protein